MAGWSAQRDDESPPSPALPRGSCNYSDLTQGPGAPVCPCLRFYLDRSCQDFRYGSEQSFFCFCKHHACYHGLDSLPNGSTQRTAPEHDPVPQQPPPRPASSQARTHATSQADLASSNSSAPMGIWKAYHLARQNAPNQLTGSSALPSTASQTSQVPRSTPAPLVPPQRYGQPSDNQILIDAAHYQYGKQDSPLSATVVNTPSLRGSPLFVQSSPRAIPSTEDDLVEPAHGDIGTRFRRDALEAASTTQKDAALRDIITRVARLESLSYSHVPLEEVEQKFEDLDCRVSSLEEFRVDAGPRLSSFHKDPTEDQVNTSFTSESSSSPSVDGRSSPALSATAAVYASYSERFQDLEQRIDDVKDSIPSITNPWRVEVVLLPWGRYLPGVWYASSAGTKGEDVKQQDPRDEWNETTSTAQTMLGESFSDQSGWSSDSIQAWADSTSDWLKPKACGPGGSVWKRLRSRGLIQTIEITSPDAFTFMQRCKTAFDTILRSRQRKEHMLPSPRHQFNALKEPLVPLRKIKKASRLAFLAPSEMVTAAAWTPSLLDSSVFMKGSGLRRLYVTFAEAYIQRADDGWTWQIIKGLKPIRTPSPRAGPGFDGVDRSRDLVSCWNHHPVLDAPPPAAMSFIAEQTRGPSPGSPAKTIDDDKMHRDLLSPLISPVSDPKTLRVGRRRTTSLSSLQQPASSTAGVSMKRRLSSKPADASKKRCLSAVSDSAKPSASTSPCLSRERSLPATSDANPDAASDRRDTPFAYPTPHSNYVHTVSTVRLTDRDGDTEAGTDILDPSSPFRAETAWQFTPYLGGRGGSVSEEG